MKIAKCGPGEYAGDAARAVFGEDVRIGFWRDQKPPGEGPWELVGRVSVRAGDPNIGVYRKVPS